MPKDDFTNEELHAALAEGGLRAVPKDHLTEIDTLTKRIDMLAAEARDSAAWSRATKGAIDDLRDVVKPLLDEIRKELRLVLSRVTYLESAKAAHAETLTSHETRHAKHDSEITGVIKRLVIVEELVVGAVPRRKKSK